MGRWPGAGYANDCRRTLQHSLGLEVNQEVTEPAAKPNRENVTPPNSEGAVTPQHFSQEKQSPCLPNIHHKIPILLVI